MGAAEVLVQEAEVVKDSGYSFTTVIMNKHTGEVLKTIRYKQVLITLEEREDMEENIFI